MDGSRILIWVRIKPDDTLRHMTRGQVWTWSTLAFCAGGGLLFYLLGYVPPQLADGQTNTSAVLLFVVGLFLLATGLGGLFALLLHKRWPKLPAYAAHGGRHPSPVSPCARGFCSAWRRLPW
ncbi:MAG: hypothetical protein HC802_06795 [Caldilineaceae bacterium]|nr:hypothetical protein [Caldilineaceae bacterium]